MHELLNYLEENKLIFNLLFSFIVTASTLTYSILTWILTKETKAMRLAQTDPKVIAYLELDELHISIVNLIVKNIGLGPAININFTIENSSNYCKSTINNIDKLYFIKSGLDFLPPNGELKTFLDKSFNNNELAKSNIVLTIHYQNCSFQQKKDTYDLRFSIFNGLTRVGPSSAEKIEAALSDIAEAINKGSKRLER